MLPSRPNSTTCMNAFGEVWIAHKSLGEHRKTPTMFQHVEEYIVQMTNILLRLYNMEIKNRHIKQENDRYVQNLQGALETEQKLKTKLQDKNNENNQVLAKLHATRQNTNNMEKESKDLENIKI